MKKVFVIISDGPMGSSTLASIISQFNYLYFPIRHLKLDEYLLGTKSLNDKYFVNRIEKIIKAYVKPRVIGGRGKLDTEEVLILNKDILKEIPKLKKTKFNSIKKKYFYIYNLFNKYCIYKKKIKKPKGFIELTTNIHNYDVAEIQKKYCAEFRNVAFVSLKRDPEYWLNSIASQKFTKDIKFKYLKIKLSSQVKRYKKYIKFIENLKDNIVVDFENIFKKDFLPNFLSKLNLPCNKNIKNNKFDHYGKLLTFKETFQKFDDNLLFLSRYSRSLINLGFEYNKFFLLPFIIDVLFQIMFIYDMLIFKINNKKNSKHVS